MFAFLLTSTLFFQKNTPRTTAELTNFKETSSHADVVRFVRELSRKHESVYLTSSGKSTEGRVIPLVIVSEPRIRTKEEAKASGKLVIYIQANIHAGEVEGKEAALHLLRKYCVDKNLLSKAILLVQPIYNGDGNDRWGPQSRNRSGQNGPEIVGIRPNGQNLDLNRDCVKLESPEMRGAVKHIYSWNPHVVFDLHTTDGTRHGYPVTYGGPGHPNTSAGIQEYCFGEFFPEIRMEARKRFSLEMMDYGNGVFEKDKWRFETFAPDARFVTNYGGLRNAITILSEAIVYEPFDIRVRDTERFVDICMEKILRDAKKIKSITEVSESEFSSWKPGRELGTRFELQKRGDEPILLEKDLAKGGRRSGPVRDIEALVMPVFDRFRATKSELVPFGYVVPEQEKATLALLAEHGIRLGKLGEFQNSESFEITKVAQASAAFQGHKLITLDGSWTKSKATVKGFLVETGQPLGRLVFDILEPGGVDGATTWGFLGEKFTVGSNHPIARLMDRIAKKG